MDGTDDDSRPVPARDRMTVEERARTWAEANHAEKPWMISDTHYPLPDDWTV